MRYRTFIVISMLLWATSSTASAQPSADSADSPWLPWLGCWQLVADVARLPSVLKGAGEKEYRIPDEQLVCVTPGAQGEAKLSTYADGELLLEETLFADGKRRPFAVSDCHGHQVTEWSTNQALLFLRSEMRCENGKQQSFTGVSFFRRWNTWVDIQALESGAGREVVIRRYRPASPEAIAKLGVEELPLDATTAVTAARAAISVPLTVDDLAEASNKIDSAAVEAALIESGSTFDLDGNTLVQLADSGISPETIDLMVALAYPDRFEVSRETQERSYRAGNAAVGGSYSYWSSFFFAPFGYYYWYTPYDSFYVERPVVIPGQSIAGGRLVKGRGYTRVGRTTGGVFGGGSVSRGGSSSSSSRTNGSSSSSSSSGSASSSGYSKGGSSSTRTAKPRKP